MRGDILWRRIAQILLISAAVIFLAYRLISDFSKLMQFDWALNAWPLIVSYVLLFTVLGGFPLVWWLLLRAMGTDLPIKEAYRIWYVSNVGRYIPGKIWLIVGRVELARRLGVARTIGAASVVYEMGLIVTSGALVFALAAGTSTEQDTFSSIWLILLCLPVGLVLIHPWVFSRAVSLFLRAIGKPGFSLPLGVGWAASLLALCGLLWVILGIGFHFLIDALTEVPLRWMPQLVGVFAASWVAGFLSIVSPGGLGVREGVMAFLLGFWFPASVSAVIAVSSRIWITIAEAVCAAVASRGWRNLLG